MEWLDKLLGKSEELQKEAEQIDSEITFERKVKANDWILDTMKTDEEIVAKEAEAKDQAELAIRLQQKQAAYEVGDTMKDTIEKDYDLCVRGLSDYNLAEMLAEHLLNAESMVTADFNEEKEKQLKSVKNDRKAAEDKLLKLIGDHSMVDWKTAFEKFKAEAEHVEPKKEDLYPPFEPGKQNWEKKEDFEAPSDKERIKEMEGVGEEEKKGQVGKDAAMEDVVIWKAVEGWNVRARFDNEQEAKEAYEFLKSQEHGPKVQASIYPGDLERHPEALVFQKTINVGSTKIVLIGAVQQYFNKEWNGSVTATTYSATPSNMGSSGSILYSKSFPTREEAIAAVKEFEKVALEEIKQEPVQPPATPEMLSSFRSKIEKKACRVGDKVYYRGHPATIKEIFINKFSGEPHVDVDVEGEHLSLSGKEIDQLDDKPLAEDMMHEEVKPVVEEVKPIVEEPKPELPIEAPVEEIEIEQKASKVDTLKKVAEVESPWTVEKQADGTEVIVRKELKKEEKEGQDLQK